MEKDKRYRLTVERIFERLGLKQRSREEQLRIKQIVYDALAREVLAFVLDNLGTAKQEQFQRELKNTKGNIKRISELIASYYRQIPNSNFLLQQRLANFEVALYTKIIQLQKQDLQKQDNNKQQQ